MADGPYRVAIIADAHFHDPAGDFGGVGIDLGGERLALRSWKDTEAGPRVVNESAAALTAALDRIVASGITHVVLAGDYTDDGQTENTLRLAGRLHHYQDRFGLRFYAIPGNHDLFGIHGKHVSTRFVVAPGQTILVTSNPDEAPDAVVTPAMRCRGQPDALMPMAAFGLFRQPEYLHWETPFGGSDAPDVRLYDATAADGSVTHRLMDASYLVEPEPGLWLLMIDANVFEPRPGRSDPSRKRAFLDPSDAGWTAVLRVKPFLLPWIARVTARARAQGKTLVTVSHYPVLDPFQGESGPEQALFDPTASRRKPSPEVGRSLIAAGLRWHAGGHLHVNAITRMATAAGALADLAVPSLVTFPGGFQIIHAEPQKIQVQTVTLDALPPDPRLTALYAAEGRSEPALSFGPFLVAQARARARTRLSVEWPHLSERLHAMTAADLAMPGSDKTDLGIDEAELLGYPLTEMFADAYLLRQAGVLALEKIDPMRLHICRVLARHVTRPNHGPATSDTVFFAQFLSALRVTLDRIDMADTRTDAVIL